MFSKAVGSDRPYRLISQNIIARKTPSKSLENRLEQEISGIFLNWTATEKNPQKIIIKRGYTKSWRVQNFMGIRANAKEYHTCKPVYPLEVCLTGP